MDWYFPAYFALAMFAGALNPKSLGLAIVFAIGISTLYPVQDAAALLVILFVPAYLLASFRD